jgi:sulfhydrogenase subunit gamma (sulfur reductase)
MTNPYLPLPMTISNITTETNARDIKTFDLEFRNESDVDGFNYVCGQFAEIGIFGAGESPIGIASSPMDKGMLQFTIKRAGRVTTTLHSYEPGMEVHVRGPYGNGFPMSDLEGSNVVIIGGGFAFTTLRSLTKFILHPENRDRFDNLTVIYGARSPGDLIYKPDLAEWEGRDDIDLFVTVDKGDETWTGREGFVPTVTEEVAPSSENAYVIVCGPPVMIRFTIPVLTELGFKPDRIINSLEMRMKCGIGKCGRCNIGDKFVCKDGPVFTYEQLMKMPQEY